MRLKDKYDELESLVNENNYKSICIDEEIVYVGAKVRNSLTIEERDIFFKDLHKKISRHLNKGNGSLNLSVSDCLTKKNQLHFMNQMDVFLFKLGNLFQFVNSRSNKLKLKVNDTTFRMELSFDISDLDMLKRESLYKSSHKLKDHLKDRFDRNLKFICREIEQQNEMVMKFESIYMKLDHAGYKEEKKNENKKGKSLEVR
ncbi:hypothetical protein HBN50_14110 [Halobacteriovorax sp. GB3]|uniref:hypothetical protein n=1 Tax=Halobacteriovorax sp. GB3 TaxID=2719615 RepID=UPI0023603753|nr:hypothetical protein [Halobacteriovorax sp. GB3]MDD0854243.1 hypothetical protein [Halobacteriovorax sp. GB3]